MPDLQIASLATEASEHNYFVPAGASFILKAVNADYMDSGAAVDWLPCVEIADSSGLIIARAVDPGVKVTAGGDAAVSWFPWVGRAGAAAGEAVVAARYITATPYGTVGPGTTTFAFQDFATSGASTFSFDPLAPTECRFERPGLYYVSVLLVPITQPLTLTSQLTLTLGVFNSIGFPFGNNAFSTRGDRVDTGEAIFSEAGAALVSVTDQDTGFPASFRASLISQAFDVSAVVLEAARLGAPVLSPP